MGEGDHQNLKMCLRNIWMVSKDKYGDATRVKTTRSGRLRVRRKASNIPIPTANDLVFLHRSPNYCHHNDTIGSLGEFTLLMNELANMNASGSHFSCSLGIGNRIWWGPFFQGDQFYGDRLSRGTRSGGLEVRGSNGFGTKCVAALCLVVKKLGIIFENWSCQKSAP